MAKSHASLLAVAVLVWATGAWAVRTTECSGSSYNTNCFSYAMYKFDPGASGFCTGGHRDAGNNKVASSFSNNCKWEAVSSCSQGADVVIYGGWHAAIVEGCSGDNFYSTMPYQPVYQHHLTYYSGSKTWYKYLGSGNCDVCGNGYVESGEQCDDGNTNNGDGCDSQCQTETVNLDGTYVNGGSSKTMYSWNNINHNNTVTVTMDDSGPFTWSHVSGSYYTWSSYNNGKNMYVVLGSGHTATFSVSKNGSSRTVTFY